MKIKFLDLVTQYEKIEQEINETVVGVFKRGDFILGEDVAKFEEEFAKYCGVKYAIGVNSGTDALFFALKTLGIGQQDEVIVPAFTYIASALAVTYTGAKPVFVDIEPRSFCIDKDKIEDAITDKTKAIIVVHLYGHPADMVSIKEIATKYNLKIIEDCAQAHGATINSGKVGSFSDIGCFSFYPSKNLGAFGDGGIITTDDESIKNKLCKLRDYGRTDKYHHDEIGYNSRLDTIQAAILRVKLKRLDEWNDLRIEKAKVYNDLLKNVDGVITPYKANGIKHVYHVYAPRLKNRDLICKALDKNNIPYIIHYPLPLHMQDVYKDLAYSQGDFPESEKAASSVISLPIYPELKKEEIKFICDKIKDACV